MSLGTTPLGTTPIGSSPAASSAPITGMIFPLGTGIRSMNFGSLVTEAQRLAGRVDSNFDDRTKKWINQALEEWATANPWEGLEQEDDYTLDGSPDLYLPAHVRKINWIMDKDNKGPIERSESWDKRYPGSFIDQTAGRAYKWREMGKSSVSGQPSSASKVYFDPSGQETVVCYVQGVVQDTTASGTAVSTYPTSEFVTCVTGAETASSKLYLKVLTLGKSETTEDDVVARYTSAGTPVARIFRDAYRSEYRHIQLLHAPASGTVRLNYMVRVPEFSDSNQITPPGVDPDYLIYRAASKIHEAMGQAEEAAIKRNIAKEILNRQSHHETAFGDQDTTMSPDDNYWSSEEQYQA